MRMKRLLTYSSLVALVGATIIGCRPKTTGEKVKDKVEDAQHEAGQAIERTGDRIQDSTK